MRRRTLRPLVALITALGLLLAGATPASATTGTITAGTVDINNPWPDFDFSPVSGTGPCPGVAPMTVDVVMSSATAGTATLGISGVILSVGTNYFLVGSGSGPVSISGGSLSIGPLSMTAVNVYADGGGTCTPVQARCSVIVLGNLSGSGSWSGSVSPPSLTGTLSFFGATGNLAAVGCAPPFSALNGKTMTIGSMAVTF